MLSEAKNPYPQVQCLRQGSFVAKNAPQDDKVLGASVAIEMLLSNI